jgi:hypothetical protein
MSPYDCVLQYDSIAILPDASLKDVACISIGDRAVSAHNECRTPSLSGGQHITDVDGAWRIRRCPTAHSAAASGWLQQRIHIHAFPGPIVYGILSSDIT